MEWNEKFIQDASVSHLMLMYFILVQLHQCYASSIKTIIHVCSRHERMPCQT